MANQKIAQAQVFEDMRDRLMKLTLKQLKQIAREEHITLGYDGSRKDTCVAAIVSARRRRTHASHEDPRTHPWRKWRSVKTMPTPGSAQHKRGVADA